jgi:hypothetical protein
MALGPTQRRVLTILNRWNPEEPAPSTSEVASMTVYTSVRQALSSLSSRRFVVSMPRSDGAACWAITPAGRDALTKEVDQ